MSGVLWLAVWVHYLAAHGTSNVDQNRTPIGLSWYDTSRVVQNDTAAQALIDAVYAYSDDGGATWTQSFLTAVPFTSADDGFGGFFMGDYLGIATAGNRTLPVYPSTQLGDADVFTSAVWQQS